MMTDRLPPIETDPLGAIRKELIGAAWRQKARADRRRRVLTVASSMLLTLVCLAGGAAAVGVEVPLVGDTLAGLVAGRQEAERQSASGEGDPTLPDSPADLAPGSNSHSEPIRVRWGSDGSAIAAAYLNRQGDVCFLLAQPGGAATVGGCQSPASITQRLDSGVALLLGVTDDRFVVVRGYVDAPIAKVEVRGPQGSLDVRVGAPWRPDGQVDMIRPFVAVGRGGGQDARTLDPRNYVIEAHLPDGRTVHIVP
jgi:hypothetical protein